MHSHFMKRTVILYLKIDIPNYTYKSYSIFHLNLIFKRKLGQSIYY
jgi:hypothetical protein